jgi:hypothetical protein
VARRVILLGASNLRWGLATVVEIAHRRWGRPLDVLAACGLGRSYGMRMPFLWRELPGITACGLWEALAQRPPAPTAALVTDIGNDLLYGVSVAQIAAWVEICLERLARTGARMVLMPLPVCSVTALSRTRFLMLRSVLYPGCRLPYATLLERTFDLDRRVRLLAQACGAVAVAHRPEWYGFDPIHIRRPCRRAAWSEILAPWSDGELREAAPVPLGRSLRLGRLRPERGWIFGREWHEPQPCRELADGTALSLY